MPVQVVRSLEEEQWQKLGAPVFAASCAATRLLDVDVESCWSRPRSARWCRLPWSAIPIACAPHCRESRPSRAVRRHHRGAGGAGVVCHPWPFRWQCHPVAEYRLAGRHPGRRAGNPVRCGRRAGRGGGRRALRPASRPPLRTWPGPGAASSSAPPLPPIRWTCSSVATAGSISAPDGSTVEKALINPASSRTPGQVTRVTWATPRRSRFSRTALSSI